ncbi:MAG: L-rhamnose isomerase, partial [Clostridia bacterium]|nr:L-rhamnose isomerase [Clostridia bacterium]
MSRYNEAVEMYKKFGVDAEAALEKLAGIPISIHCWQGDDVMGFENGDSLSGGIQTTGNYPGRARNSEELMGDFEEALSLMPGKKRINLHAIYAITNEKIERDNIKPEYFDKWIEFAKKHGCGIDFNPTFFSHEMMKDGLTLSSPDDEVRAFWIRHGITCMETAHYIAQKLGDKVLYNLWIPDGFKDVPADRLGPRMRLKDSLDKIFAKRYDDVICAVESKVFGIGVESYTVGSNEFYQNYAAKNDLCCLLDNGHYHPTEVVSDKIPS